MAEETFQLPKLDSNLHPAAALFAQTVADLANDGDFTLVGQIDMTELKRAIAYVDHTANRVHGVKTSSEAMSPERASGQITALFGAFLARYWDMGVAVLAVHSGEFHIRARGLLFIGVMPPTKAQQRQ